MLRLISYDKDTRDKILVNESTKSTSQRYGVYMVYYIYNMIISYVWTRGDDRDGGFGQKRALQRRASFPRADSYLFTTRMCFVAACIRQDSCGYA